jgi:glycine dehydrogenase subunit 1
VTIAAAKHLLIVYHTQTGHTRALAEAAHAKGALLVVVVTEIVALGALRPPGEMGADIVAAEGQSLGNAMGFGGPHLGLFAARTRHMRQMPGRLCGETVDADGRRGYVLTLATREQHIRRERATSNICTNSGLCSLAFTIHLTLLGETGLRRLAALNHAGAVSLADRLGGRVVTPHFFNEFTVRLDGGAAETVERLAGEGILAGVPVSRLHPGAGLDDLLLVAVTETAGADDIEALAEALQ